MWDFKEPTHYSRRVGREVPDVAAVLCECMGKYREVIYLAWDIKSNSYITLHLCKTGKKTGQAFKTKQNKTKQKNSPSLLPAGDVGHRKRKALVPEGDSVEQTHYGALM